MKRSCGILLHVTSLPTPYGIGDLGKSARQWIDFLAAGKQSYWQILPLGPTGFGNSPYSAFSAHAGNPMLISLDDLIQEEMLTPAEIDPYGPTDSRVRFEKVKRYKHSHLLKAFENFKKGSPLSTEFEKFCDENDWLTPYVEMFCNREECDAQFMRFREFLFTRQITALKTYANRQSVQIIGDLPMYVAEDSIDRHRFPELFDLESGFVAGSPPDDAYPMGQKWGNPLFRWDRHRENGYSWWMERVKANLRQVDVLRLDYFCGYQSFWATNGKTGHWRRGPEHDLFHRARAALGNVPMIAEDLGKLTHEIHHLRDSFGIMSTKVLQYAWDGSSDNPYHPDNFNSSNCVVYTGTHDNDTTKGWFETAPEHVKNNFRGYAQSDGSDAAWDLIKIGARSKADLLMVQFQDILCLGREARFNTPGTVGHQNWSWCLQPNQVNDKVVESLAWLAKMSNRV